MSSFLLLIFPYYLNTLASKSKFQKSKKKQNKHFKSPPFIQFLLVDIYWRDDAFEDLLRLCGKTRKVKTELCYSFFLAAFNYELK